MTDLLVAVALIICFALLVALAFSAWAKRARGQEALFARPADAIESFEPHSSVEGFYVATTVSGEPLNRISAYGLGARGRATISVSQQGLVIERKGEPSLALSARDIISIDLVSGAIDRVVEPGGLIAITWSADSVQLETSIRIVDEEKRGLLIQNLSPLVVKGNSNE